MAIEKRKFEGRASRYNLKPFHNKIIRYENSSIGSHESTDFIDISSTGLSFIVTAEGLPRSSSIIKITFSIPGSDTLTIKGQVVRTATYKRPEWYKRYYDEDDKPVEEHFVAIHFLNIKKLQQDKLSVYLDRLIDEEKKERKAKKVSYIKSKFKRSYKWILLSVVALTVLGISLKVYFQ